MGGEGDPMALDAAGEEVNLNITCSNGSKFPVRASLQLSVVDFKRVLARNSDVPVEQQRLTYKGRVLKDNQSLGCYGLRADHTVHMVCCSAPPESKPLANIPKAGKTNTTPLAAQVVGSGGGGRRGADLGASLFPGLGFDPLQGNGSSGLFGSRLPDFEQVRQQLTQNPNMMRKLISMPTIQKLMNNPELMRGLIMSNPQMSEIIDQNPKLGHILNDPGILRQTLEAARNLELMREGMRNIDRAMRNIESFPGGFNRLRRMYKNFPESFMNATTTGGGTGNDLGVIPVAALLGNQGNAGNQSREGSNTASTIGSETTSRTAAPNSNPLPNPWSISGCAVRSNTARSNSTGNARTPTGGLGGLVPPEMEGMLGSLDSSAPNQSMQSPAATKMMRRKISNPRYSKQITGPSRQPQNMLHMNPQLRERTLQRYRTKRMLTLQQLVGQLNQQLETMEGAETGGGAGGFVAPNTTVLPELYATQLSQLQDMGFIDTLENIRALRAASGDVQRALERLLGNHGQ